MPAQTLRNLGADEAPLTFVLLWLAAALVLYAIVDRIIEVFFPEQTRSGTDVDDPRTPEQVFADEAHHALVAASAKPSRIFTCTG